MTVPCYLTRAARPAAASRSTAAACRAGWAPRPRSSSATSRAPRSIRRRRRRRGPSLYGHGLLGEADEIDAGNVKAMSNEHNFVFCATPWAGFSSDDVPHIVSVLGDFSGFNTVADRMQQGFLNMLLLGRAMIHPQGLSALPGVPEGRPERARHDAAVLRRQQPGRDHGRRPHRGGARLRPRRARRARDELLHAAAAQRGLRHLRGDHHAELPEGDLDASCGSARSSCCGTAARRTATRTT